MLLEKIQFVNDGTLFHIIFRCSDRTVEVTVPVSMVKYHNDSIDDEQIRSLLKKDKLHISSISPSYDIGPKSTYFYIKIGIIGCRHEFIISDIELKPNSNVLSIGLSTKLQEEIPSVKSSKRRATQCNNQSI